MRMPAIVSLLLLAIVLAGCKGERSNDGGEKTTVKGEGGRQITLSPPGSVTVAQGGVGEITIKVERKNVSGPLRVDFDDLPRGVSVVNEDKKIENSSTTYNLKAETDAGLVENHEAKVTVKGPDDLSTTQTFRVTVKERASD